MKKLYPSAFWNYVNIFVIVQSMSPSSAALSLGLINIFIVQIFVQYYLFKYHRDKHAFSIQVAFDSAAPLVTAIGTLLNALVIDSKSTPSGLFSAQIQDFYCYGQSWNGAHLSFK